VDTVNFGSFEEFEAKISQEDERKALALCRRTIYRVSKSSLHTPHKHILRVPIANPSNNSLVSPFVPPVPLQCVDTM